MRKTKYLCLENGIINYKKINDNSLLPVELHAISQLFVGKLAHLYFLFKTDILPQDTTLVIYYFYVRIKLGSNFFYYVEENVEHPHNYYIPGWTVNQINETPMGEKLKNCSHFGCTTKIFGSVCCVIHMPCPSCNFNRRYERCEVHEQINCSKYNLIGDMSFYLNKKQLDINIIVDVIHELTTSVIQYPLILVGLIDGQAKFQLLNYKFYDGKKDHYYNIEALIPLDNPIFQYTNGNLITRFKPKNIKNFLTIIPTLSNTHQKNIIPELKMATLNPTEINCELFL